jgi:hypothetical protein
LQEDALAIDVDREQTKAKRNTCRAVRQFMHLVIMAGAFMVW